MTDLEEKSFDFAYEIIKQVITVSTIFLGISLTFFEKFNYVNNNWALIVSWCLFLFTIVFGLYVMMGVTGSMAKHPTTVTIYDKNIAKPMIWLLITFGLGFAAMIYHTVAILNSNPPVKKEEKIIYILREEKGKDTLRTFKVDSLIQRKDTSGLKLSQQSTIKPKKRD